MASRKYMSSRYATREWEDETWSGDPQAVWIGGLEYYSRTYRCRVPKGLLEKARTGKKPEDRYNLENWIEAHQEDDIWL